MERRRYGVGKRQGSVLSSWIISGASVVIFWATVILCSLYDCTNWVAYGCFLGLLE